MCTVEGCGNTTDQKAMCWKHYYRLYRHSDVNYQGRVIYGTPEERFWPKVDKQADGCWTWTAHLNRSGYGVFGMDGRITKLAHRWSYESIKGVIPDGLQLDHLCRVRSCVNPDHLEPVTAQENIRRSPIHYGSRTHCHNGHEYTPGNTLVRSDGGRRCGTCKTEYTRRSRKRVAERKR